MLSQRIRSLRLDKYFLPTTLIIALTGAAMAADLVHDTQTDFLPGTFDATVLGGSEASPTIRLDSFSSFIWTFEDDDIDTVWRYLPATPGDGVAEEDPAGQIHLRALATSSETYALADRNDVALPNVFVFETSIVFDALQPSGFDPTDPSYDPLVDQPTGACVRLDAARADVGIRAEVFSDRLVSHYRVGTTGINYPATAYLDLPPGMDLLDGLPHIVRFEVDFSDPALLVASYVDNTYLGDLVAHPDNASATPTVRLMAYSRAVGAGLAECHVDYVRVGNENQEFYASGSYTSPVLDLDPAALTSLSWSSLPASPYPWGPWVKDPDNPIITTPALVENILVDLDDPLMQPVLYDHPDAGIGDVYWMCYATGGSGGTINLAYCEDANLDTWVKYGVVLSPTPGVEGYVFSPNLFREFDTDTSEYVYYLVYDVQLLSDSRQRNAYATAPTPTGPWAKGQVILELGAPGEWDNLRVTEPFVFKEGDTYYMYYMGDFGTSGAAEQIGLATTTSALFPLGPEPGGLWTKDPLNPILPHNPDPAGWDRGLTADPSVIKVGEVFYMRYTGSYANEHWQLGTAWADDPAGPWNRPTAPDIELGPPGSWDDDRLVRGAIHFHNGRYYSPYTGASGGYAGGMASADPLAAEDLLTLHTNTSADGITWEGWLPVTNGGAVASTPQHYIQYLATFTRSVDGYSPTLTAVTLSYEESLEAVMEPLPPIPALISCGGTASMDFQLTPGAGSEPIRAYSAEIRATGELAFGVDDVTVYTVPVGAPDVFLEVRPGTDGGVIVDYSLLGPTPGITEQSIVFSIDFSGFSDGNGTVSFFDVLVRDLDIQPLPVLFDQTETIAVDCTGPGPVNNLAILRGHEQVNLTWEDPTDPDLGSLEVWRARWHDGAGTSAYPEYDDLAGDILPVRPTDPAAADASPDWTLVHTAAQGDLAYTDPIVERGVYLYEVFPFDLLGTDGSPAAASVRATNYVLGDMSAPYDGLVSIVDISSALALSYGESYENGANADYNAECDVGPTYDMTPWGVPVTDDQIQFEDLVICAVNFGASPPDPAAATKAQPEPIHLAWYPTGDGTWVLSLTAATRSLQALNLRSSTAVDDIAEANLGADLQGAVETWFIARTDMQGLDLAVARLGAGGTLAAGSEILRVVVSDDATLDEVTLVARDAANRDVDIVLSSEPLLPPSSYRLYGNVPNPFNPRTEIRFDLPEAQSVRLSVYDLGGRVVRQLVARTLPAGRHDVAWSGDDDKGRRVPSGVYFYRIEAGPLHETGKMLMLK